MNRSQRIATVLAGVVAVVVAFVVLSPGDDSGDGTPARTTTAGRTSDTATETTPSPTPRPAPATAPLLTKGNVREIKVKKGDVVRFRVRSRVPEEVHVHVYDITSEVEPGGTTRLAFRADKEGIFEIELHGSHTQIGKLVVEP
jgi:hypothetical protein